MEFRLLEDLQGIGVKDILDIWAGVKQQELNAGIAKSQNNVNEWNAQAAIAQARALALAPLGTLSPGFNKQWLVLGAVFVVLGVGYVVLTKIK